MRGRLTPLPAAKRGDPLPQGERVKPRAKIRRKLVRITTDHVRVPLGAKPTRIPLTDPQRPTGPDAVDLIIVNAETDAGLTGLGFTYVLGAGTTAVRALIDNEVSQVVVGDDARETD